MAQPWPEDTAADVMLRHRRAWRTSNPGIYRVIDRSGKTHYLIPISPYGIPICPCLAGVHERPCYHAKLVIRRVRREGRIPRAMLVDQAMRLGYLKALPDRVLVRRANYVAPGRDYEGLLQQWGRESLIRTILRYEGYAA